MLNDDVYILLKKANDSNSWVIHSIASYYGALRDHVEKEESFYKRKGTSVPYQYKIERWNRETGQYVKRM